jgi:hypothetical protein
MVSNTFNTNYKTKVTVLELVIMVGFSLLEFSVVEAPFMAKEDRMVALNLIVKKNKRAARIHM